MRESLTSPDIHSWLVANSSYITGSFVKKVVLEKSMVLRLHSREHGNRDLYLTPPGFIYFGEKRDLEVKGASKYLMEMLENLKVESISQPGFDRIVRLDFYGGKSIVFEMFGKGNIILLDSGNIIFATEYREWRGRSITKGAVYRPPPSPVDPRNMDIETFSGALRDEHEIVGVLATRFNLSHYSEHICSIAGVDKEKIASGLSDEEMKKLYDSVKNFIESIDGRGYICNGKIMCIRIDGCDEFENINEAIIRFVESMEVEDEGERIEREQRKKMEEYIQQSEIYRKMGEEILSHLELYSDIIEKLRKRESVEGLVAMDGRVARVKLGENSPEVELDITKKASEIAQHYYSEAKKLEEKVEGIKRVIGKIRKVEEKKERKRDRKRFWFEKYRWFISSENSLVLAGRDARTNEEVVKKYLGERDYYVHADIHGAPSVVVKNDGITEKTLVEAGIFGLCYSKAWSAGFMAGDAYWVTYSQVSKMGESGEYVPRGAWVIRGKRNYMRNLRLEIAVGKIKYQDQDLLMAGPVDSLRCRTNSYFVITPGELKKEAIAKRISEAYSWDLDEVVSILPPGPGRIVEEKHEDASKRGSNGEE